MDTNQNFIIEPKELIVWIQENEKSICRPYDKQLNYSKTNPVSKIEVKEKLVPSKPSSTKKKGFCQNLLDLSKYEVLNQNLLTEGRKGDVQCLLSYDEIETALTYTLKQVNAKRIRMDYALK